jgi:hypothetical protein
MALVVTKHSVSLNLLNAALQMGRGRPTEARIPPQNACTRDLSLRIHQ